MKKYINSHNRGLGLTASLIALMVAVIYWKVLPSEAASSQGLQSLILTYGHSLCWLLLAGASLSWAINRQNKLSATIAYLALASYIIFIITLLLAKFA